MTSTEEVEQLLAAGTKFAMHMLEEQGDYSPYGVVLDLEGEVKPVALPSDAAELSTDDIVTALLKHFREGADSGNFNVTALFTNVHFTTARGVQSKAIQIGLEHRAGECFTVYVPYSISEDGTIELGEKFAEPRIGTVF